MKKEEKEKAILLRKEGKSLNEISRILDVSKGSVSSWVRDVVLDPVQRLNLDNTKQIDAEELRSLALILDNTRAIASKIGVSQSCVIRNLKKIGVKTTRAERRDTVIGNCQFCYRETDNKKTCNSCITKIRRIRSKWAAVKRLGAKCGICCLEATIETSPCFEFHHKHNNKDFNISSAANKSWAVIVREVDKCQLLCSNCHRIKHAERDSKIVIYALNEYKGDQFDF